jgi:hypothetical protein
MARIAIKIKAKPKTKSRAVIKSFDEKHYGSEPIVVTADAAKYGDALNWYNYMHDNEQAREWLLEYMKNADFKREQIAAVRRCPKYKVITTIGWQARIMMNGNVLAASSMAFFNERLNELYVIGGDIREETANVAAKPVVDIQARIRARTNTLITMIEEQLDGVMNGGTFDIYSFMQKHEVTPQIAGYIRDYYLPMKEEADLDDEQVNEAYGKKLKFWRTFYSALVADCDKFINNRKAVKLRKPREKKVKSAVDVVKALKYQKEEPSLRIVSVHPTEVVGCNQLWVYNTKYKKLTQYISMSPQGIQVKGTTLIGWDTELSVSKSLRKPEITIPELLKVGKVAIRSFMPELKTAASAPNGRLNEQTILLRVIK